MGELKLDLINLGDVTGCTIVVKVSTILSKEQAARLLERLVFEMPEAAHILVADNDIDISIKAEEPTAPEKPSDSMAASMRHQMTHNFM